MTGFYEKVIRVKADLTDVLERHSVGGGGSTVKGVSNLD
jgi:hypothetical protein